MIVIDMNMPTDCVDCWINCQTDTCPIKCDIEDIKAEIKAEMRDHDGIDDFYTGIRYGLRYANGIIGKHTK